MAVDWWLLANCCRPVVRLYDFSEATVSLGYRQQFNPPAELKKLTGNFPVVVRPTGGGYLLHSNEITFSWLFPPEHKFADFNIKKLYRLTRGCLVRTVTRCGLDAQCLAENREKKGGGAATASCLARPGAHEPVIEGKKWMAAAQARHEGTVLEQGSIFWDSSGWPHNLLDSPYFISNNIETDKRDFTREFLVETQETFPAETAQIRQINGKEWLEIESLAQKFQLKRLAQLPLFKRTAG